MRVRLIAVVSAALLLLGAASDAAAKPATISGKVPGGAPKVGGQIVSTVSAVRADTGLLLDVDLLGRAGRYRLRVQPGPVVVLAHLVPRRGKAKVKSSRVTKLKSGARKRVKVTKKRPKPRKRRRGRSAAHAAQQTNLVKVTTAGSVVTNGVPGTDTRALEGMMTYEVWSAGQRAPCDVEVYVDRGSGEWQAMQAEVRLQQGPGFDPGTRVTPRWHLPRYRPNSTISTQLTLGPDGNTISGTVSARGRSGKRITKSVSGTWSGFFFSGNSTNNDFDRALDEIFRELCKAGLSEIGGTFSGEATITPPGSRWTWNGTVAFERLGGDDLPGAFGTYRVAPSGGVVTYRASGRYPEAVCQMSGTKQFNIPPGSGSITVFGSLPDGFDPYTYGGSISTQPSWLMEVTLSGCQQGATQLEGTTQMVFVGGLPWDTGQEQFTSEDGRDYIGTRSLAQGGVSYSWSWAFAGN
ncbi:MAG TPA: hypothetical protein VH683_09335 [Thermoleophilaceae bacterium]